MNTTLQISNAMARLVAHADHVAARRRWYDSQIVGTVTTTDEFGRVVFSPVTLAEATELAIERAETRLRFREAEKRISRDRESPTRQLVEEFAELSVKDINSRVPKFSAVVHSGGALSGEVVGIDGIRVFIDLAKLTVRKEHASLLLEGVSAQRVGMATQFSNDGRRLVVRGAFSAATVHRDEVVKSAKNGYPWRVVPRFELPNPKVIRPGEMISMNGQTLVGPAVTSDRPRLVTLSLF